MKQDFNIKDIEDLEALMEAIAKIKQTSLENNTEPVYTTNIKKETVRLKYILQVRSTAMEEELGLPTCSVDAWTMQYKNKGDATALLYGKTTRYDIPTKCLVVQMAIEDGIPNHKLAEEYNVSQSAISHWKSAYKHTYKHYINAPERTMIIGKESKSVIGLVNIKKTQLIAQKASELVQKTINTYSSFSDTEYADNAVAKINELADNFN